MEHARAAGREGVTDENSQQKPENADLFSNLID
jgi:hypothetical protein